MQKKTIILITTIIVLLLVGGGVYWWWQNNNNSNNKNNTTNNETTTPKTYSEVFNPPIDPNLEPERHKEVYEKIQKIVHFPVLYPETMPEGWRLVEVDASGASIDKISNIENVGVCNLAYEGKNGSFILTEGPAGDFGSGGEKILLINNKIGYFWSYQINENQFQNVFWFGGTQDFPYVLSSYDLQKEELIEIANFIISTNE